MTLRSQDRARWLATLALLLGASGCAYFPLDRASGKASPATVADDAAFYRAASLERDAYYEREVARLHADLEQAEQQIIAIESGLRGAQTRADAVSAIADARIAVSRASKRAPWRVTDAREAGEKLQEAEQQLVAGHAASAVFFASRASRIAANIDREASQVERNADTRFVNAKRVNLRAGPSTDQPIVAVLGTSTPVFPERRQGQWMLVRTVSGPIGWLHSSLVRPR